MDDDCFVIGIDFGTTYSGVSYCWSGEPDAVDIVTRWKSTFSHTSDNAKTPTEICYGPDRKPIAWGYQIPADVEPIRWFKLLLVDQARLPREFQSSKHIQRARQLVAELQLEPIQVVADYLRLLWEHALAEIARDRGESVVLGTRFKVWITVPAIWDPQACERMRTAAQRAGILKYRAAGQTVLDLVAEPEAAALAVLDDYKGRPNVKKDDVFVVCDAGGGTVDIISYKILSTNPLRVQECVEGDGKLCGAIFVDEAFESYLKVVLGPKWNKMSEASRKSMIHNEWENGIKKVYDDTDRDWSVTVPPDAFEKVLKLHRFDDKNSKLDVTMVSGQLRFQCKHIQTCFGQVIPHIKLLIQGQVSAVVTKTGKKPSTILLVGGLGACNYLYQQLKRTFSPHIDILQPNGQKPWTAICRGAVIRGLSDNAVSSSQPSRIVSRVSRLSYGISHYSIFRPGEHLDEDREWSEEEGRDIAKNQMTWFLYRGSEMTVQDPVTFGFTRLYQTRAEFHRGQMKDEVFVNDEERPPTRKTANVRRLACISAQVDTDFDDLPTWTGYTGVQSRKVAYDIHMTSTGTTLTWKVLINGKVQGEENVRVDRD